MSNRIKFSHNWNNKLNLNVFTTIRTWSRKKVLYYLSLVGHKFDVLLKDKKIGEAELQSMEVLEFSDIPDALLMYDTGLDLNEAGKVFAQFGLVKLPNHQVIILTFKK